MDAKTQAAFERLVGQIKAHPLFVMAPPGAEAHVRAALADGIDRREAAKIKAALDTPKERAEISGYIKTLGLKKTDVLIVLRWLTAAVDAALDDAKPVEVVGQRFKAKPLFKESRKQFKCSGACIEADGTLVMGVYGNDMPRNRCEILHDGKKVFPSRGYYDAETLFPYPGGFVVAERGYQLRRSGNTYKPTKCLARWAACMSVNPATIYNSAPNSKIKRLDFDTGKVIQELPGTDVPHDATTLQGGIVAVAVEGYGIVYTDTRPAVRCKPRAHHVAGKVELVGDAGRLRQVSGGKLIPYLDGDPKLGEVIDSITSDGAGIWFTTSNEDACWLIPAGTRTAVQVISFDDAEQGGSVFGCTVVTNGKRRVFIRNNGSRNSWEAFEIVADVETPTPDAPPPTDDAIPYADIKWFKENLSGFRKVSKLKAAIVDGKVIFTLDRPIGGTDAYAVSVMKRQGYAGGPFDGVGKGDRLRYVKGIKNMGSDENERKGPYWTGTDTRLRAYYKPKSGELVFVLIVDLSMKTRTNIVAVRWP